MRKRSLLFGICLSLCLLAGCAGSTEPSSKPVVPPESDLLPAGKTGESIVIEDGLPWFMTLRIVSSAETGELVLAENSETGSGVYTLSTRSLSRKDLPKDPLQDGQLINVYYESFTESWPMNFGGVSAIEIVDSSFNNRAAIYLQVLEDLWDKDSGLNDGVEIIGVDLSQTSLTPAEQSAVAWVFAGNRGTDLVEGSLEELIAQGYITAVPLSSTGSGVDLNDPKYYWYHWENGCHFSITEPPEEIADAYTLSLFDAQKWRSSMGAYFFSNCWLIPAETGGWSGYDIGAEAIS